MQVVGRTLGKGLNNVSMFQPCHAFVQPQDFRPLTTPRTLFHYSPSRFLSLCNRIIQNSGFRVIFSHQIENDNDEEKELILFWSYKWLPFKMQFFDKNHDTDDKIQDSGQNDRLL